jgi:hypothetical protein
MEMTGVRVRGAVPSQFRVLWLCLYLSVTWHSTASQKTVMSGGTSTLTLHVAIVFCRIGRTLIGVGSNPNSNMGLAVINLGVCNLPPTFRTDIANK